MINSMIRKLPEIISKHSAAKFIIVGVTNNAIGYILFVVLSLIGFGAIQAMTTSYAVGMVISFTLNRRWTFEHRGSIRTALLRFLLVNLVGYIVNFLILWTFVNVLSWPQIPTQLGAIIVVAITTFVIMGLWVFSSPKLIQNES